MENKITIQALGERIIILEGQAPDPINQKSIGLRGSIDAPKLFYLKTKLSLDAAHVEYNDERITLTWNVGSSLESKCIGMLTPNPLLESLSINKPRSFTLEELQLKLRECRDLFAPADFRGLIAKLGNYSTKISADVTATKDEKGNSFKSNNVQVKSDILEFTMQIETNLFVSAEKERFTVMLEAETKGTTLHFYLVSDTLAEATVKTRELLISKSLEGFDDIPVLRVL